MKSKQNREYFLFVICVSQTAGPPRTLALRVSRNAHKCLSTYPQVEPLVQKENFLSRYYRRRARRLACSNQAVSLPSCDVDTDLLSDCSEYTSYMPSRRIQLTALFSFLSFSLVIFTFSKHFLFLSLFLIISLSWRLFYFVAFNCTQPN